MNRFIFPSPARLMALLILLLPSFTVSYGQSGADGCFFRFPDNRADWPAFRQQVMDWRNNMLNAYTGENYSDSNLTWIQGTYLAVRFKPWSRLLVDESGNTDAGNMLGFYTRRFGGVDLFWMLDGSPLLGLDGKNQWDYYRSFSPYDGQSFTGLSDIASKLRGSSGARMVISYASWDHTTRREPVPDNDMLIRAISETGVDGVNWNLKEGNSPRIQDNIRKVNKGAVLIADNPPVPEDEDFTNLVNSVQHAVLSIEKGDWGLIAPRWFERRHCISIKDEGYGTDNTIIHGLHLGFLNGCGWLIGEESRTNAELLSNHDISWIRLLLPVLRRYQDLFTNQGQDGWIPCIDTGDEDVYASYWQKDSVMVWTVVNRSDRQIYGRIVPVREADAYQYYDLIRGRRVEPDTIEGDSFIVDHMAPRGMACYLATVRPDSVLQAFLREQGNTYRNASWNKDPLPRNISVRPAPPAERNELPPRMYSFTYPVTVELPAYSYENSPVKGDPAQGSEVTLLPFAIDIEPVTNEQWQQFIRESGYVPFNTDRYLQHWRGGYEGQPETVELNHPVVWISPDDAQAYARYYRKRLPTHYEYRHALQKGVLRNGAYHYWNLTGDLYSTIFSKWVYLVGGTEFTKTADIKEQSGHSGFYAPDASESGMLTEQSGITDISDPRLVWELFLGPPAMQRFGTVGFRCAVDLR